MDGGHNLEPSPSSTPWGITETGRPGGQAPKPTRKGRGVATRMRFVDALIAFGVYLALQFAAALIAGLVVAVSMGTRSAEGFEAALSDPWMILVLVTASAVAALSGVALVAGIRRLDLNALGLRPTSGRWLLAGLGMCALGILVNIAVVWLYVRVTGDTADPQAALMGAALKGSALQFVLMLLLGGVIAPIGEELLFRGILFPWLRRWGLPLSVILSALAFGLFHGFNIVFVTAAILGAMFALLYEWSGSLWPPIIAHAANNLFSFAFERLMQ